jgi:hypothetical protein
MSAITRIALTGEQVLNLPSFPATDEAKDTRYKWSTARYGDHCWELDAMDPNDLRDCVEKAIKELIEPRGVGALRSRQRGGVRVDEERHRRVAPPPAQAAEAIMSERKQEEREQPVSCPWPAVGNLMDPEASADAMRWRFAEMEKRRTK